MGGSSSHICSTCTCRDVCSTGTGSDHLQGTCSDIQSRRDIWSGCSCCDIHCLGATENGRRDSVVARCVACTSLFIFFVDTTLIPSRRARPSSKDDGAQTYQCRKK